MRARDPARDELNPVSIERQILFWAILFAALGYVLHLLGPAVTPFAAGIALGYLLDPVVYRLEKIGVNRLGAALIILVVFAAAFVVVLIVIVPILAGQLVSFAQRLPDYAIRLQALAVQEGEALIEKYGGSWINDFGLREQLSSAQLQQSVGDFVSRGAQWLVDFLRSLVSGGAAVFDFLSVLIITPVVAFYILVDWERMVAEIDSWLPVEHREQLRQIAREINQALAGFVRGQSLVCLFLGLWYGIGLTLVGLDFGFLIGCIAGLLSFIPYVGSLVALVLSMIVALVQGWPGLKLLGMTLVIVVSGQFLEGYVVSPKLVGESIGLHPVWLMFALLAFGQLFGFVGLVIAVPVAAAAGVIARHLIGVYLASPFYRSGAAADGK
jgi:predicted PurR-regulated permease PerM